MIYKITFAGNSIVSVTEVRDIGKTSIYHVEGQLVYAFVEADTIQDAYSEGRIVIQKFLKSK